MDGREGRREVWMGRGKDEERIGVAEIGCGGTKWIRCGSGGEGEV